MLRSRNEIGRPSSGFQSPYQVPGTRERMWLGEPLPLQHGLEFCEYTIYVYGVYVGETLSYK